MQRKKISAGITAFIDILGFGDRVVKADSFQDIESVEESVQIVRNAFDYAPKDPLTLESQKTSGIKILAFSDSVIVNVPLQSESTKYGGTFDPIMSEIQGFAYAQGICVQKSLFIRGGVDIGWWYQNGSILISQSLTQAYRAEGKAKYPVIALTDDLVKYFSEHSDRNFYSKKFDPISTSLRKVSLDGKEVYFIDYIKICLDSLNGVLSPKQRERYLASPGDKKQSIINDAYHSNIEAWLVPHAKNIEAAHALAAPKVKEKYEWLAEYHNEIARKYSGSDNCLCHLH